MSKTFEFKVREILELRGQNHTQVVMRSGHLTFLQERTYPLIESLEFDLDNLFYF